MKITDIQSCIIGREEPHSGGCVWTFVRVYTDEGIVGTGECNSSRCRRIRVRRQGCR